VKLNQWIGALTLAVVTLGVQAQSTGNAPSAGAADSLVGQVDAKTEQIKQRFSERFGNMPIKEVRYAPFGLFEVQIGSNLVYTNEDVTYVLDGHLIDANTRADLTEARLEELARINFSELPLELAITQVRGDGSRKMAIFEDPNCGYCKKLRRDMVGLDNVTIYTFMLPILSEDSVQKVKNIWCASDRGAAWDDWMLSAKVPPNVTCEVPLEAFSQLGRDLGVQGTPAIFFADGSRVPGAISREEIEKRLQ
jgi:thiol:disulfide interchange protein DsbC